MYDRGLCVLEQYGMEAAAVYRGRGALICDTEQGLVLIREFCGAVKKLEGQASLLNAIARKGKILTDEILSNQEGTYISLDSEGIPYIVKRWYEGKECDTRKLEDICEGVRALAELHREMRMPIQAHYIKESLSGEFSRHNRELRKIRKFMCSKRRKNDFELEFLDSIRGFLSYGEEALRRLEESGYEELRRRALQDGTICHGEYNQHNVLILGNGQTAATNFDKWGYDVQTADLYQFMRKILEKHDWDLGLGKKMLLAYHETRPVTEAEVENLRIRFAYPEKFWKLANYYYVHNKAWISEKNLEKLRKLKKQEEKWRSFGESLEL